MIQGKGGVMGRQVEGWRLLKELLLSKGVGLMILYILSDESAERYALANKSVLGGTTQISLLEG